MRELNRKAQHQIEKMQYHTIMGRKHKHRARVHYTNLIKIFRSKETVKKILKEIGRENTIFNNPEAD